MTLPLQIIVGRVHLLKTDQGISQPLRPQPGANLSLGEQVRGGDQPVPFSGSGFDVVSILTQTVNGLADCRPTDAQLLADDLTGQIVLLLLQHGQYFLFSHCVYHPLW